MAGMYRSGEVFRIQLPIKKLEVFNLQRCYSYSAASATLEHCRRDVTGSGANGAGTKNRPKIILVVVT